MNIEICEMTKEDWPEVSEIYSWWLENGNITFHKKCPPYDDWDKGHLKDCRFIAKADGKTAGFCVLSPTSQREAYKGVVEISIYLKNGYTGYGIGKMLIEKMINESEKKGYWTLYASIFSINKQCINMLEKCGFRYIGYREKISKDKFGVWQDTTYMERRSKKIM